MCTVTLYTGPYGQGGEVALLVDVLRGVGEGDALLGQLEARQEVAPHVDGGAGQQAGGEPGVAAVGAGDAHGDGGGDGDHVHEATQCQGQVNKLATSFITQCTDGTPCPLEA